MDTWNYRIVRYKDGSGYGLHEVFYDASGAPADMTSEPISFTSDTDEGPSELIRMLEQALRDAQGQTVLDEPESWPDQTAKLGDQATMTALGIPEDPVERLLDKMGQAYQIIGYLVWEENPRPSEAEQIRALDYYSNETAYDPDFLPWPRR